MLWWLGGVQELMVSEAVLLQWGRQRWRGMPRSPGLLPHLRSLTAFTSSSSTPSTTRRAAACCLADALTTTPSSPPASSGHLLLLPRLCHLDVSALPMGLRALSAMAAALAHGEWPGLSVLALRVEGGERAMAVLAGAMQARPTHR